MPKKPRPRAKPAAPRKKARRRPPPPAGTSEAPAAVTPRAAPVVPPTRPVPEAAGRGRTRAPDYGYVFRELRRIAIVSAASLLLVVILSFVLR